jgi:hypothetical protein
LWPDSRSGAGRRPGTGGSGRLGRPFGDVDGAAGLLQKDAAGLGELHFPSANQELDAELALEQLDLLARGGWVMWSRLAARPKWSSSATANNDAEGRGG